MSYVKHFTQILKEAFKHSKVVIRVVNQRRTDKAMAKRKRIKRQCSIKNYTEN
jgi:hypothetical protein